MGSIKRSLEECVVEARRILELADGDLLELRTPVRGTERPLRDAIVFWRAGNYQRTEIGSYINVGYASVVSSRKRGEKWLRKHRRA